MMDSSDTAYMLRALELAKKGYTSPNPMVGAVIVRDNKIIGEGFHTKAGEPHAEINALRGIDASGATLYVTLEPCSHYGRTPPCTDAIINSGISRVVCAMQDPNPKISGIKQLKEHGIDVKVGLLEGKARKLNEAYITYMTTGVPFVVLKSAMSLDGKTATSSGDSKWITGEDARSYSHKLRGRYDAILVGINTVLADDPSLRSTAGKDPLRVILDSILKIPLDSKVLSDSNVLIATTGHMDSKKNDLLKRAGIEVLQCGEMIVDFKQLIISLGKLGITSVYIEGGSEVNASAIEAGVVDKIIFFIAPKLIAGVESKPVIGGHGSTSMADAKELHDVSVHRCGNDIIVEAYLKPRNH